MDELIKEKDQTDVSIEFNQFDHNKKVENVEAELLKMDQVEVPLRHLFAPDVYIREVTMKAGSVIIGHEHKTEHFNIVLTGKAEVIIDDVVELIEAPSIFISKPGVRKILNIIETMTWATVHPTSETKIEKLEDELIDKSNSWIGINKAIEQFKDIESKERDL